jgi:hypothetical protein
MASKTINISVDETTKAKAQAIFESLGDVLFNGDQYLFGASRP